MSIEKFTCEMLIIDMERTNFLFELNNYNHLNLILQRKMNAVRQ